MPKGSDTEKRVALIAYEVARARLGHRGGFNALVELCSPGLYAHARRLCDAPETARDIVQDAWVEIARTLPKLREDRAFLAFALRIVTRMAARDLSKQIKQRTADAEFAQTQVSDHSGGTADPELALDLTSAIDSLPQAQRLVLALFHVEGLSVAEVATALDIPPGTVKTRLMHARARLRAFLEGDSK